jgi:Fe-S cluster assembly protein SufD
MEKISGQLILNALTDQFETFEKSLNGQSKSNAHQIRKNAFNHLVEHGFPHAKSEEYKFTNLTKALEKNFELRTAQRSPSLSNKQISSVEIENLDAHKIVFINGKYSETHSDKIDVTGLKIIPLNKALKDSPEKLEAIFSTKADYESDPFIALNTAFSQDGIFIEIEDNVIVARPIMLHFIGDCQQDELLYQIRNIVKAGKFSQCTIIEKFDNIGSTPSFTNAVVEIDVAENAFLKYFKIENDTDKAYHVSNIHASQAAKSTLTTNTYALNGAIVRNNLNIMLEDEGCEAYMNGLYLLDGKTHVDNHTVVDHKKPNCYSNELYKGIMDGSSRGVFNGKIFVRKDAQKTNAFQSNKNVLLTNKAIVNTKPQLEIWADDVKCSHGCTTGQLDMEALFYLQSRGIQKEKARGMLLQAFANDVLETVSIDAIKDYLKAIFVQRLKK